MSTKFKENDKVVALRTLGRGLFEIDVPIGSVGRVVKVHESWWKDKYDVEFRDGVAEDVTDEDIALAKE